MPAITICTVFKAAKASLKMAINSFKIQINVVILKKKYSDLYHNSSQTCSGLENNQANDQLFRQKIIFFVSIV